MSRFLSGRYKNLDAYVPGEQPADMRYIKLNTNESPYPPPPGVIAALTEDEKSRLNLYPSTDGTKLRDGLAGFYGVHPGNVIIGNGSDELLAFAFMAFCDCARGVAFPDITYGLYPVYAELYGVPADTIPLRDDFTIDPADYFGKDMNIVIANPNAPTGIALSTGDIEAIVKSNPDRVVLIDEAYVDFGAESAIPLTLRYDNLLVVHTYSKSRSLAGARLAYAIGQKPLIDDLNKIKYSFNPYNVNRLTQTAGAAALLEDGYYKEKCREIMKTREHTKAGLKKLGFTATESAANFLFVRHPDFQAEPLYEKLKECGILVRHFSKPRISDWLRITIGTGEQMTALLGAVEDIIGGRSNAKE